MQSSRQPRTKPLKPFDRNKQILQETLAKDDITEHRVDLASTSLDLVQRYEGGSTGLPIAKGIAELASSALKSDDAQAVENVNDWIQWLDNQTEVEAGAESELNIPITSVIDLLKMVFANRGSSKGRYSLPKDFKGYDMSVSDQSTGVDIKVSNGSTYNRHRGAILAGDLPEMTGIAVLAGVEDVSKGGKFTVDGNMNDSMGVKFVSKFSGGPESIRRTVNSNRSDSDEEYSEARENLDL